MSTTITLDGFLAHLDKFKVPYKFYKSKSDALSHNRNAAQGWGPIRGMVVHNFASDISDSNSLAYLYNGDSGRNLPGPLSQLAITDDGMLWILGWGTANHCGPGDYDMDLLIREDKASLTSDFKPNTTGTSASGTTDINPHYIGVEMTYGNNGPTAKQQETVAKLCAATMDMLGPGYTGGSVAMHREFTMNRSDPQAIKGFELRKKVNTIMKGVVVSSPTTPTPAPVPTVGELPKPPTGLASPNTYSIWYWDGIYEPYRKVGSTNPFWTPASYLIETYRLVDKVRKQNEEILAKLDQILAK